MYRIDILLDYRTGIAVFDALHKDEGVELTCKVAHLYPEIRFGEYDIYLNFREFLLEFLLEFKRLVARVGTREGCYLHPVAGHGAHTFVELYMLLDQLRHLDVARNLYPALAGLGK